MVLEVRALLVFLEVRDLHAVQQGLLFLEVPGDRVLLLDPRNSYKGVGLKRV